MQARSKSVRGTTLALKYAPGERPSYRLAVVVSRKVSKSAVVRNRIRRRLYERVRNLSSSFKAPYDLVLVVYDEKVATMPPEQLSAEVAKLCVKAKITPSSTPVRAIVDRTE
jgi:ribonuclease P protein component